MTGSLLPAVKTGKLAPGVDPQAAAAAFAAAHNDFLQAKALHALKLIGGGALLAGAAGRGAVGLMDYLADKPKPKTRPGVLEVGIPVPAPKVAEADLEISPSTLAGVLGGLDGAVTGGLAGGAAGSLGLGGGTLLLNQFRDPKDRRSVLLSALQGLFGGGGLGAIAGGAGGAGGAAGASTATGLLTGELFEEPATEVSPEAAERAGGFPDAGSDEYGTAGGEFGGGSAGQPAKTAAGEEGYFRLGDFASGDLATSVAGIPWFGLGAVALGLGGAGAGWVGTDRLIAARRKARSEAELEAKRKAFAQALAGDLPPAEPAKVAGVTDPDAEHVKRAGLALDRAFDALAGAVKRANDPAAPTPPTPPAPGGWPEFNNAAGALTGAYGAGALVLAALAASKMYAHQRSRGDRAALDRAVDLHRRLDATGTPLPVYAVPKVAGTLLGGLTVDHPLFASLVERLGPVGAAALASGAVSGAGTGLAQLLYNRTLPEEERVSVLPAAARAAGTGAALGAGMTAAVRAASGQPVGLPKVAHTKQANPDWLTGLVELLKTNPRLAYALLGGGTGGLAGLLGGGSLTHALLGALAGGGLGYGAGVGAEHGYLPNQAELYAKGQKAVGDAGSWLERQLAGPKPGPATLPDGRQISAEEMARLEANPQHQKDVNRANQSPEGLRGAMATGAGWVGRHTGLIGDPVPASAAPGAGDPLAALGGGLAAARQQVPADRAMAEAPDVKVNSGLVAGLGATTALGTAYGMTRAPVAARLTGVGRVDPRAGWVRTDNLMARNMTDPSALARAVAGGGKDGPKPLFPTVATEHQGAYRDALMDLVKRKELDAASATPVKVQPRTFGGTLPPVELDQAATVRRLADAYRDTYLPKPAKGMPAPPSNLYRFGGSLFSRVPGTPRSRGLLGLTAGVAAPLIGAGVDAYRENNLNADAAKWRADARLSWAAGQEAAPPPGP